MRASQTSFDLAIIYYQATDVCQLLRLGTYDFSNW